MTKIAVYGTLRQGYGNHVCLGDSKLLGTSKLPNFGMVSLGGFPAIDREEGSEVVIEVYDCDAIAEARCNRLEGYDPNSDNNTFYDRITVDTEYGEAEVYVMHGILEERTHARVVSGDWNEARPSGSIYG